MSQTKSLSAVVSLWTAASIAGGMAVYGAVQYATTPGARIADLLATHLWHVIALGLIVYALSVVLLQRSVVLPLQRIHLHLYGIGAGRLQELHLPTRIREIRTIVDGVNLMVRRIEIGADHDALAGAQSEVEQIRQLASRLPDSDQSTASAILASLSNLERNILALVRKPDTAGPKPPAVPDALRLN